MALRIPLAELQAAQRAPKAAESGPETVVALLPPDAPFDFTLVPPPQPVRRFK